MKRFFISRTVCFLDSDNKHDRKYEGIRFNKDTELKAKLETWPRTMVAPHCLCFLTCLFS